MAQSRLTKPKNESVKLSERKGERKRLQHVPMLVVAVIAIVSTFIIVTQYYPIDIANKIVHQSYLVLLLPVFIATSFTFGYILLNLQRGVIVGWLLTILLFLKLQNIDLYLQHYLALFLTASALLYLSKVLKA